MTMPEPERPLTTTHERAISLAQLIKILDSMERLDAYLQRRWPEAQANADLVEIRDDWDTTSMTFAKKVWRLNLWREEVSTWQELGTLEPGERPRMFHGYCYIVKETTP